jgi:hypothetical protein
MQFKSLFSRIIYTLVVINATLWSTLYWKLSYLSDKEYMALNFAGYGFWRDYLIVIIILVFLPAWLHSQRYNAHTGIVGMNPLQEKSFVVILCYVLPFIGSLATPRLILSDLSGLAGLLMG